VNELQHVIEDVTKGISNAEQYDSAIVGMSRQEAQALIDAAQLVAPLQERCQLLGRALAAIWGLVSEHDRQAIAEIIDVRAITAAQNERAANKGDYHNCRAGHPPVRR
jgi:hypothetical protein